MVFKEKYKMRDDLHRAQIVREKKPFTESETAKPQYSGVTEGQGG